MPDISKEKIIFLGGTCGNNKWRDGFIDRLVERGLPRESLFNPVVSEWNEEARSKEDEIKKKSSYNLYYLADPQQDDNHKSFYSLGEAIMGGYDNPEHTLIIFDSTGMPLHANKSSAKAYEDLKVRFPDSHIFQKLSEAEDWLVKHFKH
jgi:hypothetical protein